MLKVFVLVVMALASAPPGARASLFPNERCAVQIEPYRHVVEWSNRKIFEIRAARACTSQPGRALELENVQLKIVNANGKHRPDVQIESASALLSWEMHQVVFDEDSQVKIAGRQKRLPGLAADWRTRELRSTNGFYIRIN